MNKQTNKQTNRRASKKDQQPLTKNNNKITTYRMVQMKENSQKKRESLVEPAEELSNSLIRAAVPFLFFSFKQTYLSKFTHKLSFLRSKT